MFKEIFVESSTVIPKTDKFFVVFQNQHPIINSQKARSALEKHFKSYKILNIDGTSVYGAIDVKVLLESKTKKTVQQLEAPITKMVKSYIKNKDIDLGQILEVSLSHPLNIMWKKNNDNFKKFFTKDELESFTYENYGSFPGYIDLTKKVV